MSDNYSNPNKKGAKKLKARVKSYEDSVANVNLDTNGYHKPGSQNRRRG